MTAPSQRKQRQMRQLPGAGVRQAMALCGLSRPVVEGLVKDGRLTLVMVGPHRRITLASIEKFLSDLGRLEDSSPQPPLRRPAVQPEPPQSKRREPRKAEQRPTAGKSKPKAKARLAAAE